MTEEKPIIKDCQADVYECGHRIDAIFIKNKDVVFYQLYKNWKESKSKLCFDCWNTKRRKDGRIADKRFGLR